MGLVEGVVCKVVDLLVDGLRRLFRDAIGYAATDAPLRVTVDKSILLLLDLGSLLLGDGPAHHVRLAQGVAAQALEDLDDLLLIDDAAIGNGENGLQRGVLIGDQLGVLLAGDKPGDGVHGTGAVEGDDGGDILDALRLEAHANAGHAAGLDLEHAAGLAPGDHLKGLLIVFRDARQRKVRRVGPDHLHRIIQHRQVPKAQEVHLEKAQLFQGGHHILADHRIIVFRQGHVLIHRPLGDDHARGVGGGVAGHTLQGFGGIDELLDLGVRVVQLAKGLTEPQSVTQGHIGAPGDLLCDLVYFRVWDVHDPAHIPDNAPGGHGAKGHDLSHVVIAVLFTDVIHYLSPSRVAKVHINIRHTDTLRVQKALKIEAVLHGVNVRNIKAIAYHRAGGAAAAGAHRDIPALGVADKVGDDEKIVRKAHFLDHIHLVFQLGTMGIILAIAAAVSLVAELLEIGPAVVTLRELELRQVVLAKGKLHIAHLRNFRGVFHGALVIAEELRHLRFAAEVEVPGLVAHPVLVLQELARLDAQQHIVGLCVFFAEVMGVVGADHGEACLLVEPQDLPVHDGLVPDTMVLDLQIEPVRAEELGQLQGVLFCVFILAVAQLLGNFTGQAGRKGDEALMVLSQQGHVDAGLDVKPFRPGHGNHIGEVAVALLILTQQHQVAAFRIELMDLVEPGAARRRYIDLTADDGFDPLGLAGAVKVDSAVHGAVVRDGTGSLSHFLHHPGQILDTAGTVQKAEFRMDMKMDERHGKTPFQ